MRMSRRLAIYNAQGDLYIIKDGAWQAAGGNWASRGVSYNTLTTGAVAPTRSDGSGYIGFNTSGNNTDLRSGTASAASYTDLSDYNYLRMTYDFRIPPMDISKDSALMRIYCGAQNATQFAATSGFSGMTLIQEYLKSNVGYTAENQTATINISARNDAAKPSIGIWWGFLYTTSDTAPGYIRIRDMWFSKG